jgi:hydrogenase expression/formation protein HypD
MMLYLDEYRDPAIAMALIARINARASRRWVIMEVCGGQTHTIVRYGLDRMLEGAVELVHGPGCPVCVTPLESIDRAHAIAARPGVILASFGDMLRVPGSTGDLIELRARGADVRVVYSPLDALELALQHPDREVVFLAVGFETTAPANAMALHQAIALGITNFSMLVSHVLVPPAIATILEAPDNRVQAFLGPGHVCSIVGTRDYEALVERHRIPIVVTGFEPLDLLEGVLRAVEQLEAGRAEVENQYARSVERDGSQAARDLIERVFTVEDRKWRGIGPIADSGYRIRPELAGFDAALRYAVDAIAPREPAECLSGLVLTGQKKPCDCPAFGTRCTPLTPLGATMVSSEGACAAYYQHGRRRELQREGAHAH